MIIQIIYITQTSSIILEIKKQVVSSYYNFEIIYKHQNQNIKITFVFLKIEVLNWNLKDDYVIELIVQVCSSLRSLLVEFFEEKKTFEIARIVAYTLG